MKPRNGLPCNNGKPRRRVPPPLPHKARTTSTRRLGTTSNGPHRTLRQKGAILFWRGVFFADNKHGYRRSLILVLESIRGRAVSVEPAGNRVNGETGEHIQGIRQQRKRKL